MPSFSVSSLLTSLITFWQNIAIALKFPRLNVPPWLAFLAEKVILTFEGIKNLIPKLPDFDLRANLVFMGLGIPLLLDVLTLFFALPLFRAITHILDLAAGFGVTYVSIDMIYKKQINFLEIIGCVVCLIWLIGHCIYHFLKKKEEFTVKDATHELSKFYFDGIIPGYTEDLSLSEINMKLSRIMSTVQIVARVASPLETITLFGLSLLVFVVALVTVGAIDIDVTIPATVKLFLPYFLFPIASILLVLLVLKSTAPGAKLLLEIKKFIKRWGLRLLLLAFELLYIPIMSVLLYSFVPIKFECSEEGYVPMRIPSSNPYYLFIKHNLTCVNASVGNPQHTKNPLRLQKELALGFLEDVLAVNGGVILFVLGFIMVGVPVFWNVLVNINRDFVFEINVFGRTIEEKWMVLTTKLNTTGIFLFQKYTVKAAKWSVWLILSKLIIMILSAAGNNYYKYVVIALPVFYICMCVGTYIKWPYLFRLNNWLDFILYILNTIFTFFPVLACFNVNVDPKIVTYISLGVIAIPIISCILFLFCGSKPNEDDPTVWTQDIQDEIEALEIDQTMKQNQGVEAVMESMQSEMQEPNNVPYSDSESFSDSESSSRRNRSKHRSNRQKKGKAKNRRSSYFDEDEDYSTEYGDDDEDEDVPENEDMRALQEQYATFRIDEHQKAIQQMEKVEIEEGALNSIKDMRDGTAIKQFKVYKAILAVRFKNYYEMLDLIIDAQTIDYIIRFLNICSIFAAAAIGWYISALLSSTLDKQNKDVPLPDTSCVWSSYNQTSGTSFNMSECITILDLSK